ncbi:MAG: PAS domain-containing protein [Ginsengibacter sp.]
MAVSKIIKGPAIAMLLQHQAFENSLQANIISTVRSGKIIMVNRAACKLLEYSKKELLSKTIASIFDISEPGFKKMLKEIKVEGHSVARVTTVKKSGKKIPCEITSAVFTGEHGIKKSIFTIADRSQSILLQKNIDDIKEKTESDNTILAKLKQKGINIKKEKIVADNIILALAQSDARLAENTEWIKYIAKASYDVMWDWNIATSEIYVGDSEEEVFGYHIQNNTIHFKDFIKCLVPEEKNIFEKKLREILAAGNKSWKDSFKLRRKDGSIAAATSRASIIRNKEGKAVKLVGAIQDISRVKELERNLLEQDNLPGYNRERFIEVAKLSFDIIWDWNIVTGEVFKGEGFEKLLGSSLEILRCNISELSNHVHPDDKKAVEKKIRDAIVSTVLNFEFSFRFIRADGSVANVFNRASIIRDADGKACRMIGVFHDLSWQKELEEKLVKEITTNEKMIAEYEKNFRLIFNSASDVLFDSDLVTNKVLISDAYKERFGYTITNSMTLAADWLNHIYPDDKAALFRDFTRAIKSKVTEWKYNHRFLKVDNSVVNVRSSAIILRDIAGKAYRVFGSMHDDSKQQVLEEKLEQEINLKDQQISNAVDDAKETERADIGKELHDNTNQLLSASKLYIDMAKKGGENSKTYLRQSSKYTQQAIDEIRKLTKGLTTDTIKNLGLCEAIENISAQTMEANPIEITCSLKSFRENTVHNKFKLNIYRIVQEQLNNILKHSKASEVKISLLQDAKSLMLSISDNGGGFDTVKKQECIALANIKSRAATYNGKISFTSQFSEGSILQVKFAVTDALLNES